MARAAIATKPTPARLANTAPAPVIKRPRAVIAPPPVEEPDEDVAETLSDTYPALMDAARSHNQAFKPPHAAEDHQVFLKRLASTIAQLTDDDFAALPEEAQEWHGEAVDAINQAMPLPEVPGMAENIAAAPPAKVKAPKVQPVAKPAKVAKVKAAPEPEPEEEDEDAEDEFDDEDGEFDGEEDAEEEEPEPVVEAKPKKKLPQALLDRQQAQRDAKAEREATAAPKPVKAAKPAPKPVAAPIPKGIKGVELIRRAVLDNPEVSKEEIIASLNAAGLTDTQPTTVSVTMSGVLACISYLRANDRWVDAE